MSNNVGGRISHPGGYRGYSEEVYDGYQKRSCYFEASDGVKLAIDIYRPTKKGVLHTEKLPVVWTCTQYQRAKVLPDGTTTGLDNNPWWAPDMTPILRHGYVIAALDTRGTGASFGTRGTMHNFREMWDLYEVNEWLAAQEWCCGKTGMFGLSFLARVQYMAAISHAPSLKCIFPEVGGMCQPQLTPNGVGNVCQFASVDEIQQMNNIDKPAPPVDEDTDGSMLKAAIDEHRKNPSYVKDRLDVPFTDSISPRWGTRIFMELPLEKGIIDMNNTGVAVCIWGGWNDFFAPDTLQWYSSLTTPKRLIMGNWAHGQQGMAAGEIDWMIEHLRWYDYWLKGIDNGIMDEPPVWLYNVGKNEWRTYGDREFPLSVETSWKLYLSGKKADSIESVNDGYLSTHKTSVGSDRDLYTIDYSVTKTGLRCRWKPGEWMTAEKDYRELDKKSLTYTGRPLGEDLELTGSPVADLWVGADTESVDFYIYLEDVAEDGTSIMISDGVMRTANRKPAIPVFNNMGLPYHTNYQGDQLPLPEDGSPVELSFSMYPLSYTVPAGHRLRVTINNFDRDNWDTPQQDPAPVVRVYHSAKYCSHVVLPVVK